MRFWDVQKGEVIISNTNIKEINTQTLRDMQSFVTQETHVFHDTIEANIKIAKLDVTREETKTFCSNCTVHCYKTEKRELIRSVMRFSGPRMMLCHPIIATQHVIQMKKEK